MENNNEVLDKINNIILDLLDLSMIVEHGSKENYNKYIRDTYPDLVVDVKGWVENKKGEVING